MGCRLGRQTGPTRHAQRQISAVSRRYLGGISATSRRYLGVISAVSRDLWPYDVGDESAAESSLEHGGNHE